MLPAVSGAIDARLVLTTQIGKNMHRRRAIATRRQQPRNMARTCSILRNHQKSRPRRQRRRQCADRAAMNADNAAGGHGPSQTRRCKLQTRHRRHHFA